jgi:predicted aspartyl protease
VTYSYREIPNRPAAPYVNIEVHCPSFGTPRRPRICDALLDTGADRTYIPEKLLRDKLQLSTCSGESSTGIGGDEFFFIYIASIRMEQILISDAHVFGWKNSYALVGRDILKSFHICFDGQNQEFSFSG